jgi:hypothetical protein
MVMEVDLVKVGAVSRQYICLGSKNKVIEHKLQCTREVENIRVGVGVGVG